MVSAEDIKIFRGEKFEGLDKNKFLIVHETNHNK